MPKILTTTEVPEILDNTPKPEGPFLIEISDEQRIMLVNALVLSVITPNSSNNLDEINSLRNMLQDLPKENTHNLVHGLCF